MSYSVQLDVQNALGGAERLVEAFDWDRDGTPDATVIADCIAEADAKIDSYASKVFSVPFSPVPDVIRLTSARLAVLNGARRRGMMTHDQQLELEELIGPEGWLVRLAKGIVTPGGDPLPPGHTTMQPDFADTRLPEDREASRRKLGGFW